MNKIPPEIYDRILGGPRPEQVAAYQAHHEAEFANDPESVDDDRMLEGLPTNRANHPLAYVRAKRHRRRLTSRRAIRRQSQVL
jgi:hypothetical protein